MNYGQIYTCDVGNGPGCRTSLFVSGCTHHCKDCFNEVTWDFNYGEEFTTSIQDRIIKESSYPYISGLTILGGEPMEVVNQKELRPFIERFHLALPDKSIWMYSGYTWEELNDPTNQRCHSEDTEAILSMIDVLVDGEFIAAQKNVSLTFRGSTNQRIIDVPATRKAGIIVLSQYNK